MCVFLPLLPRNMKMVDIVAQKMPSENDVHVARSFLTKILRSSMRYGSVAPSLSVVFSPFSFPPLPSCVPCARDHINHSSSSFPSQKLSLSRGLLPALLGMPFCLRLSGCLCHYMIFIPFVQHAKHCLAMKCKHM